MFCVCKFCNYDRCTCKMSTDLQVSVSCGIPDFRSRDGIYAKLSVEYPDLPDPQAMFDISYFYQNPRPFFKFAKVSYKLTEYGCIYLLNGLSTSFLSDLSFSQFLSSKVTQKH